MKQEKSIKQVTVVFPDKKGVIAPEIYGHFSEHIGGVIYDGIWVGRDSEIPNIKGFRKDIIEKMRALNPPVIRWPGGCFAETYHWRDGIGKKRPVRPNWWTKWDGRYESNEVGTHEFMEFCELIGAKPYFAVNVTSITPMEARDWMDYCLSPRGTTTLAMEREANGHPEPFDIPYWGVGNENWGDGGQMTPEYYASVYRRFATVLKNICADKAELVVGGANNSDYHWTHVLASNLEGSRAPYDAMSMHYYCSQKGGDAVDYSTEEWYNIIADAANIENVLCRHAAITEGHGVSDRMKLVIDEWGCWHPEGSGPSKGYNLFEQQSTMRDAVVAALSLNIFNNHCDKIKMANIAQVCNNLHSLFLAQGKKCIVTPTYHVFHMYKEHQGAECLRTLISDNDDTHTKISVSASVKGNTIKLTLANMSCEEDVEVKPNILGLPGQITSVRATLLTADDMRAHNTFESPETVSPVSYVLSDLETTVKLPKGSVLGLDIEWC